MPTAYKEACETIEGLALFTKKHQKDHTVRCLELLGHPERGFRVIHAAGTNGKGSVCAFTECILRKAGLKTGLFVSPHLVSIRERFVLNGELVSRKAFVEAFEEVRHMAETMEKDGITWPSYFEFLFLMGMVIFARAGVDIAVLETGLGGRLDATNAVEKPCLTVITPIGMDHTAYLGDTIEAIAGEKAGILKPKVPLVCHAGEEAAKKVIMKRAASLGIEAISLKMADLKILSVNEKGTGFIYEGLPCHITIPAPYEAENAALALCAVKQLRRQDPVFFGNITENVMTEGLSDTCWPGRMECLAAGVYADGAHNLHGLRAFIRAAKALTKGEAADILFGVMADKDDEEMVRELCTCLDLHHVTVTAVEGSRGEKPEKLRQMFNTWGICAEVVCPVNKAYNRALSIRQDRYLFCVGSLYMVGSIKELSSRGEQE